MYPNEQKHSNTSIISPGHIRRPVRNSHIDTLIKHILSVVCRSVNNVWSPFCLLCVTPLALYSSGNPTRHKARHLFWSPLVVDIVPLCPFFWSFVFYLQHCHPTLPRSTESRPRFHWRAATLPLSHFPSRGIAAQRARSQWQEASEKSRPMSATLLFT